ncbi:uncharacterized protein LOC127158552 [Labeo rohita]|uniref:uncharacterized protein LOC127158552 n=1 Tax=Labeo rohita TaxID=84645 RepID=UPI0021E21AE4|nr:uncharacterized protein LOC127158552 [Labeo rohita]
MRRALSKRRHRTTTEAVYEEVLHKQRGSVFSEEQHSGYDNADELLSEEQQITPENYDDVIAAGWRCQATDDLPENYDDVVIVRQFCSDKTGVATFISEGVQEEYDDVKNVCRRYTTAEDSTCVCRGSTSVKSRIPVDDCCPLEISIILLDKTSVYHQDNRSLQDSVTYLGSEFCAALDTDSALLTFSRKKDFKFHMKLIKSHLMFALQYFRAFQSSWRMTHRNFTGCVL